MTLVRPYSRLVFEIGLPGWYGIKLVISGATFILLLQQSRAEAFERVFEFLGVRFASRFEEEFDLGFAHLESRAHAIMFDVENVRAFFGDDIGQSVQISRTIL